MRNLIVLLALAVAVGCTKQAEQKPADEKKTAAAEAPKGSDPLCVGSPATTAFGRQTDFDPGRLPVHKSTLAVYGFESGAMAQVWISYELPAPGLGSMVNYLITGSTGMIRLENITFDTGKAELKPEDLPQLDIVGQVLTKWPELRIEIGGHTDSRGSAAANQRLSEARVKSVLEYLLRKFPELKPEQYTTKGYGESRPLVPNLSPEAMARNRRVEFVVLNKEVLKREIERRKLLEKQ